MRRDEAGLTLTVASADAAAYLDAAVDDLLHFRPAVVEHGALALATDPTFVLAGVLDGYLRILSTDPGDAAYVAAGYGALLATSRSQPLTDREQRHVHALGRLARGDLRGAGRTLRALTDAYPRDVLALAAGHQIDFFTGDAAALRDRPAAVVSAWSPADRHFGVVLGMAAFGMEEAGHYDRSADLAARALAADPLDVWGVHAQSHTFEMQAKYAEGIAFLDASSGSWTSGNYLNVHNWWHYGLFTVEAQDFVRTLAIYDASIRTPESTDTVLEMLDAASLLWRVWMEGAAVGSRFTELAERWVEPMRVPHYAFNDLHAVMAYVGADRYDLADDLVAARERYVAAGGPTDQTATDPTATNLEMTAVIGLPVCRALIAFGRGDHRATIDLLAPIRSRFELAGGSHAQRDVLLKTLIEACLLVGEHDLARVLLSERTTQRPCSPYAWLATARLADSVSDAVRATGARATAASLLPA